MKVFVLCAAAAASQTAAASTASTTTSAMKAQRRAKQLAQQRVKLAKKKVADMTQLFLDTDQYDSVHERFTADQRPTFAASVNSIPDEEGEPSSQGAASFVQGAVTAKTKRTTWFNKGDKIEKQGPDSDKTFIYLGCYLDDGNRRMSFQENDAAGSAEDSLTFIYKHCVEDKKQPYFAMQYAYQSFCGGNPAAGSDANSNSGMFADAKDDCGKKLINPVEVDGVSASGGDSWGNAIYLTQGPTTCPTGYTVITPTDSTSYGDMPQPNDAGVSSVVETTLSGCGTKCDANDDCVATASDGSQCFIYTDMPAPSVKPANFITCEKIDPSILAVEKLAAFVMSASGYLMDEGDAKIADANALADVVKKTKLAAIDALAESLR